MKMFNVNEALAEIKEIAEKHNLMDFKLIGMYGPLYAETVAEKLQCHAWTHYKEYDASSKITIKAEIKGTIKHLKAIVEHLTEQEKRSKVKVRMLCGKNDGKIIELPDNTAKDFVTLGFAELV